MSGCRCNCGYRCGGPGKCKDFGRNMMKCINEHFVRDCDHDFSGELKKISDREMSVVCQKCGLSAGSHDCMVGP